VVLNSGANQALASICIDTYNGLWWVCYVGKSDGSETQATAVNLYCKASNDSGTTWGPETALTSTLRDIRWIMTVPRTLSPLSTPPLVAFHNNISLDEICVNVPLVQPSADFTLGL
jgi:hypothetical protein